MFLEYGHQPWMAHHMIRRERDGPWKNNNKGFKVLCTGRSPNVIAWGD